MIQRCTFLICLLFASSVALMEAHAPAAKKTANRPIVNAESVYWNAVINTNDTVLIDVMNTIIHGDTADIPVMISSDDTINALDFSFQYDHSHLLYDTTITKRPYISGLAYYNTNDSMLRYTSYSLNEYEKDTILVLIRFKILIPGSPDFNDLFNATGFLNGDVCTISLQGGTSTSVAEHFVSRLNLYPNPVNNLLTVSSDYDANYRLVRMDGSDTGLEFNCLSGQSMQLDLSHLPPGMYLMKDEEGYRQPEKVMVCH